MVTTTEYTEKVARAALQSHAVCCAMTFVGHAWVNYGSLVYHMAHPATFLRRQKIEKEKE